MGIDSIHGPTGARGPLGGSNLMILDHVATELEASMKTPTRRDKDGNMYCEADWWDFYQALDLLKLLRTSLEQDPEQSEESWLRNQPRGMEGPEGII